ncbi:hypothetical protein [Nocardia carnea]|uniref:hypothetical protein n=1 Tax=Nocardia carnea TaxID=37328 RepID=UPI00245841B3|nr:hypothetical protein [Nocardia carnea]
MENPEVLRSARRLTAKLNELGLAVKLDPNPLDDYWEPMVMVKVADDHYEAWATKEEGVYDLKKGDGDHLDDIARDVDASLVPALFLGLAAISHAEAEKDNEARTLGPAVTEAAARRAAWITAVRHGTEKPGFFEMSAYFAARRLAVTEVCRSTNEALTSAATPDEVEAVPELWDPKNLTELQRLFIDELIATAAVEYLVDATKP